MWTKIKKIETNELGKLITNVNYWYKILESQNQNEVKLFKKHISKKLIFDNGSNIVIDVSTSNIHYPKTKYAKFVFRYGEPEVGTEIEINTDKYPKLL